MNLDIIRGKTPRELGYRMPAEWGKHEALWLSWPYDPSTFPFRVEEAEETYLQIVKQIHKSEVINLFVKDDDMKLKVTRLLRKKDVDLSKIRYFQFDYADVWFRDYGPTFVINQDSQLAIVHWIFNSWGEKYDELLRDRRITPFIKEKMLVPCFEPGIVLEGGSVDVNGKGTVITTEQCLLNRNRNPDLDRGQIESCLKQYLNVNRIIWLKEGIAGDDTDGHVDDIARFVNNKTIVCSYAEDRSDENFEALNENYEILLNSTDQDDQKLKIIKLPNPIVIGDEEKRLPASYTNFYIGNQTVLVPVFSIDKDKDALLIIRQLFPNRRVVGIDCYSLVHGLGAIHCITQQQPLSKFQWRFPQERNHN